MSDLEELAAIRRENVTADVLAEVLLERQRQHGLWGEQNPPDGVGPGERVLYGHGSVNLDIRTAAELADHFRNRCDRRHRSGRGTWTDILLEELFEALAESDPAKLRAELVQVAAVAVAWIEAIDRRYK